MKKLIIPIVMAMLFFGCKKDRANSATEPSATGITNHKPAIIDGSYTLSQATNIFSSGTTSGTIGGSTERYNVFN